MRRDEPLLARLLLFPLLVLSAVVGLVARGRRSWSRRSGGAVRVSARVVSIGNVVAGGAGKTPVTIEVARRLRLRGCRVAVLSRGYGRASREPTVVSDGANTLVDAATGGDEPLVIARALPDVPVLVGADRAALARQAIERFGAEVIVLDDGFQHLRLARDLDIAVVDGSNPAGNGHLMPRGPLREPWQALSHAQLAWISKVERADPREVERLAAELTALTGRPPVQSACRVRDISGLDGASLGASALGGRAAFLLSGLARPEAFRATVLDSGARIVGEAIFGDHHAFTSAELDAVEARARAAGAEVIAVTAKDAAKLSHPRQPGGLAYRVVHIELELVAGGAALDEVLFP